MQALTSCDGSCRVEADSGIFCSHGYIAHVVSAALQLQNQMWPELAYEAASHSSILWYSSCDWHIQKYANLVLKVLFLAVMATSHYSLSFTIFLLTFRLSDCGDTCLCIWHVWKLLLFENVAKNITRKCERISISACLVLMEVEHYFDPCTTPCSALNNSTVIWKLFASSLHVDYFGIAEVELFSQVLKILLWQSLSVNHQEWM